jgi:2-polyprenyl-6-methoxyphenol hydroxylase-like FAD-dependent oxidoreductase
VLKQVARARVIRKALVIGGGIGGLSAAIALRKAGIDVDLVELQTDWKVYHVGVIVQGNFIRAMEALGIVDEAVAVGFPLSGVIFQTLHGQVVADIPGIKLASPQYPSDLGMARPALHRVLSGAALRAGAKVRLGVTYTNIEQSADAVRVQFTDGAAGTYDVVVGADGVHSKLRSLVLGSDLQPQFTGQGVWRYNVPRPQHVDRMIMCMGLPGGKCGFVPLTRATGYVLLVQSEPGNPKHPADRLADIFRERLAPCTGLMAELREHITDSSKVVYRPLEVVFVPRPWYRGRVVLIGDAVHTTTPHLGQGAAQAVEDAVVLGELLTQDAPLPVLLEKFMDRRHDRCRFIQQASIQIGEWEQRPTPDANPQALTTRMLQTMAQPI